MQERDEAFSGVVELERAIISITIFLILCGIILSLFISRSLRDPLKQLERFARKMAQGDLSKKLNIDRKDEFGTTIKALNASVDNIKNLIKNIQAISLDSKGVSQNIVSAVQEVAHASEGIYSATEQIAGGANEQAGEAAEIVRLTTIMEQKLKMRLEYLKRPMRALEN